MALMAGTRGSNSHVMTAHRARLAMAVALAGGAGVAVVVTAVPAYAAGSLNAPSGTVTSASPVTVTATGGSCGGSLPPARPESG